MKYSFSGRFSNIYKDEKKNVFVHETILRLLRLFVNTFVIGCQCRKALPSLSNMFKMFTRFGSISTAEFSTDFKKRGYFQFDCIFYYIIKFYWVYRF